MKKILAHSLCLCMLLVGIAIPVSAAEIKPNTVNEIDTAQKDSLLTAFTVNVDKNGNFTIAPYNTDLLRVSDGANNSGSFNVSSGKNVKIHMYISSVTGSIKVYARKGALGGTYNSQYLKATWTGKGHHYADLFPNASAGTYSVFVYGAYSGSGAVYTEP